MPIELHTLPGDKGMLQKRKRVGRGEGSGQGKTAGKGHKGETARSGTPKGKSFEGGQTPVTRRLPKRGFSHKAWSVPVRAINLSQLDRFDNGATVDFDAMVAAGLVGSKAPRVKILGNGEIKKSLTVVADAFSASARAKIEAAGGACRAPAPAPPVSAA
jgi:large subunit ribosomal protein L15